MNARLHRIYHYIRHFFTAKRGGHGVHSPFVFSLCRNVFYNKNEFYAFNELQRTRKALLADSKVLEVRDYGAGSQKIKGSSRKVSDIAKHGISSQAQSEMLFRLITFLGANTIIELGTSIGLNTLYLSKASKKGQVYTLEGSSEIFDYAAKLAANSETNNIEFSNCTFDAGFPPLLERLGTFDLLYIDGNHTYESTLAYFIMAMRHSNANSVIVLDDIYWSEEMTRAWNEIVATPEVLLTIDTFHTGFAFFKKEILEKTHAQLYVKL